MLSYYSPDLWCNTLLSNHLGLYALNRVRNSYKFVKITLKGLKHRKITVIFFKYSDFIIT